MQPLLGGYHSIKLRAIALGRTNRIMDEWTSSMDNRHLVQAAGDRHGYFASSGPTALPLFGQDQIKTSYKLYAVYQYIAIWRVIAYLYIDTFHNPLHLEMAQLRKQLDRNKYLI